MLEVMLKMKCLAVLLNRKLSLKVSREQYLSKSEAD